LFYFFTFWLISINASCQMNSDKADNGVIIYENGPYVEIEKRIAAKINGNPVTLSHQITTHPSKTHFMESARVRLASDGPVKVELDFGAIKTEKISLRKLGADLPYQKEGSLIRFELPGPGNYYMQVPALNQNTGTEYFGTYTLLFWIDDIDQLATYERLRTDERFKDVTVGGVISDPTADQTKIIQGLINQQGIIYFPPGIYRSGALKIPSNTTLYLAPGALLKGTDDYHLDEVNAFLTIQNQENVKIIGQGIIDTNGKIAYSRNESDEEVKIRAVNIISGKDIEFKDVLFQNSNSWAIHIFLSENFKADNVKIFSGKDGFDPDASKNVVINNAFIQSYDDAIAVKTRSEKASDITENVTFKNSIVSSIKSSLKIGTETRAAIRNVRFENCDVFDGERGIVLYARDGGPIENITWKNIRMFMIDWPGESNSGAAFDLAIEKRKAPTPVKNVVIENITTNTIYRNILEGLPEANLDGVIFRNVEINVDKPKHGKPYLFQTNKFVAIQADSLVINWKGNKHLYHSTNLKDAFLGKITESF